MAQLRPWQGECLDQQLAAIAAGQRESFVAAGVGAGKTTQALALYLAGDFDLIVAITPKSGIRGAWQDAARELGIVLQSVESAADFQAGDDLSVPHGYVLNAQILDSIGSNLLALCAMFRVLLVVDEAHHMGEDLTWAETVAPIAERAAFVLAMSGTPYRSDEQRIRFLKYERNGPHAVAAPDYVRHHWQSIESGDVVPIVTRFIGGSVTKHAEGAASVTYDYGDHDYYDFSGGPDETLMGERLRLSAVECLDWQMAAIGAARRDLMRFRADSDHPWGGLVVAYTVDQARKIATEIEHKWGDRVMLIVGHTSTEPAVEQFREDISYIWAVSITKISEGINIERLRVGVLLSQVTTRNTLEQIKGRLARKVRDIPQLAQVATFYVPADPRLIDHVLAENEITLHSVRWLAQDLSEQDAACLRDRLTTQASRDFHGADLGLGGSTPEMIRDLVTRLRLAQEDLIEVVGAYTLEASARFDGAALEGAYLSEERYRVIREELACIIHPLTVARMKGEGLEALRAIFADGQAHGVREIFSALADVAGLPRGEIMRAAYDAAKHSGAVDIGEPSDYRSKQRGYWTLARCVAEARKYTTQVEWRHGSSSSHVVAGRNGWMGQCTAHMLNKKRHNGYWTQERCMQDAAKYTSRNDWLHSSKSGYHAARKNGWMDECTAHMVLMKHHLTFEQCMFEAKKYTKRKDWQAGHSLSYAAAYRNGWLDECAAHMVRESRPTGYWTFERCAEEARKYTTPIEWSRGNGSSYGAAGKNGWLDECTAHMARMQKPRGYWTLERCMEAASKYPTSGEWKRSNCASYGAADKNGWLYKCTTHMAGKHKPHGYWTLERCKDEAGRYTTRSKWRGGSPSSYAAARRNDWENECTAHMAPKRKPHGYWTLERCMKKARCFTSRREWQWGNGSSYLSATRNGWLDTCTAHMVTKRRPPGYWTLERCMEKARLFPTRPDWRDSDNASYHAAYMNDWMDTCTAHMVTKRRRAREWTWTLKRCMEEARRFATILEWLDGHRQSYRVALAHGWLDKCTVHMPYIRNGSSTTKSAPFSSARR